MVPFLMIVLMLVAVFLIMLVLVQRGRGGGLAGALGGMGGQSAFGTKAGDLFTRITIVVAAVWILCCIVVIKKLNSDSNFDPTAGADFGTGIPADSTERGELMPGRNPGGRPGALANPDGEKGSTDASTGEGTNAVEGTSDAPADGASDAAPTGDTPANSDAPASPEAPAGDAKPAADAPSTPSSDEK